MSQDDFETKKLTINEEELNWKNKFEKCLNDLKFLKNEFWI
jgi:hypothetical protein